MEIVTEPEDIDLPEVEKFVVNHPNGNFFQSTEAYQFYRTVKYNTPLFIVAKDGPEIIGSLLAVVVREGKGPKGFFSRRCIVSGGPLVKNDDPEICAGLLSALNTNIKGKAIYTQFRNFNDMHQINHVFLELGWKYEEHLNILIDLRKPEDALWKDVGSKKRNQVRRAAKEGTGFKLAESSADFLSTVDILTDVYDRAKLPLPGRDYFLSAFEKLSPEHLKVFVAVNHNKIVGTLYALSYKNVLYDWYAGAYQEYYNKYPNDLLPWSVFLWGKENGYHLFDFGGAGKPDKPYGVREYKKQFGGKVVNFGRYEKVHHPILFQIGKAGFVLWQKIKK